jgi:hypothetical protein
LPGPAGNVEFFGCWAAGADVLGPAEVAAAAAREAGPALGAVPPR